jgi:hypothetical protein
VQTSLRKVLIDSHVAVATIAVMLFFTVVCVINFVFAMWDPALELIVYIATAVTIRGIPSAPVTRYYMTGYLLPVILSSLLSVLTYIAAAWVLSHWVYGTGPLQSLANYQGKLVRKNHA